MVTTREPDANLTKVQVAKPCPADWREMRGDERMRHCTHCSLNVYNIAEMSTDEAADLLRRHESKVCVRFYRRGDGGIMTKDCPRGVAVSVVRTGLATASLAACIGILTAWTATNPEPNHPHYAKTRSEFVALLDWIEALVKGPPEPTMGQVALQ